jgi:hypothetical protein
MVAFLLLVLLPIADWLWLVVEVFFAEEQMFVGFRWLLSGG